MWSKCGFAEITLDGTKKDWINLKEKARILLDTKVDKKFGVQWSKSLLPLLDKFIIAFDGEIDCLFWNSMIKRGSRSGNQWYSGWINILFPYIEQKINDYCVPYDITEDYVCNTGDGPSPNKFPIGLGVAPVIWVRYGKIISMKFLAGFMGYKQDPETLEICPNIGWCIATSKT